MYQNGSANPPQRSTARSTEEVTMTGGYERETDRQDRRVEVEEASDRETDRHN